MRSTEGEAHRISERTVKIVWWSYAVFGLLLVAAHGSGLLGPLSTLTPVVCTVLSGAAIIFGVRVHRPPSSWPWNVLLLCLLFWFAGGVAREVLGTLGDLSSKRSLLPDLLTLPGYVLTAAACLGLNRARSRGQDLDALLDGLIPAMAALLVAWVFLINPALAKDEVPISVRLVLACYPPMSVLVLAVAVRVVFVGRGRLVLSQQMFVTALILVLVGDVLYMLLDAGIAPVPRLAIDVPYACSSVVFGLVVLHPTMRALSEPVHLEDSAPGRWRLLVVAATLGLPAIVAVSRPPRRTGDGAVLIAMIFSLTVLGTWRIFRALREHARSEARLFHQATHDSVTGLPNRVFVNEHLTTSLLARTQAASVAVIFIDVDRFKLVNDTSGHSVGDQLLVAIGRRLESHVRPGDFVGRVGGDEFVVIMNAAVSLAQAAGLAERLHQCFGEPFELPHQKIFTSASLGVAFADPLDRHIDAGSLVRDADMAMYEAKQAGRDGVAIFDSSMRDRVAERVALEQELRVALVASELHVQYQSIVNTDTGLVTGCEALMRWQHPQRGLVPPSKFVPIAEDTGLISEFGLFVLNEACREVAQWRKSPGGGHLSVSVNVSPRQLRDSDLSDAVARILLRHELPGEALCLELTESMLMDDPEHAVEVLGRLRALGVRLSIDDFGTGYSSLAYLKRFPVDQVKIDKSFVDGLADPDSSEESLVAAIIAMAKALRVTTVAEGVEHPAQVERLQMLRCDRIQGFFYSRPVLPHLVLPTIERLRIAAAEREAATGGPTAPVSGSAHSSR